MTGARRPQAAPPRRAVPAGHPSESVAEIAWLQPYPDALLEGVIDAAPGPEARYEAKEAIALAFVSGLQHLPRASGRSSCSATCSASTPTRWPRCSAPRRRRSTARLQRARGTMEQPLPPGRDRLSVPRCRRRMRELVSRFADAFERDDIDTVVAMLTEDAVVSMPPEPEWHQGRARRRPLPARPPSPPPAAPVALRGHRPPTPSRRGRYYLQEGEGWRCAGVFVVGVRPDGIESITRFRDGGLLDRFGVPARL